MVAETAEIARTNVSAEEFLAMVGFVVLQHKISMEDAGATFFIMKTFPIIHHGRRDNDLIEDLPIGLMLQGAFEP